MGNICCIENETTPTTLQINSLHEKHDQPYQNERTLSLKKKNEIISSHSVKEAKVPSIKAKTHEINIGSPKKVVAPIMEIPVETVKSYQKKNSRVFEKSNFIMMKNKNLFDEYQFCDRIGEGAYGFVYKTLHKKMKCYRAIKAIKKSSIDEKSFFNEINILKTVDHPNIIRLFETYYDTGFYYMVEEYCSGGDLYDYIKRQRNISEKKVAKIIFQVLQAVNHLHAKSIVHRDLKPENIVFVESEKQIKAKESQTANLYVKRTSNDNIREDINNIHIKIIDFGTSTHFKDKKLTKELGTIYYIAPEVFKNNYDNKCDIWSCGIILYTLLCGHPPFRGNKEEEIKNKILNFSTLDFNSKEWRKVSKGAQEFVTHLLAYQPSDRPTASEALKNQWLKDVLFNNEKDNILDKDIMQNIVKFHSSLVLQKAVLSFLTNQIDDNRETNAVKEEFDKIDVNKDGVISKEELAYCLSSIYPREEVSKRVDEIFNEVDFNNDNTISFSEFVTVSMKKEKLLSKESLKKAFEVFDLDGNGFITRDELDETLPAQIKEDNSWDEIIAQVDIDGDGRINFEEFAKMMELYIKQIK